MSRYQLFGRCLESDLPFPELMSGTGSTSWVLNTLPGRAEPPAHSVYLGEDTVQGDIRVRLYRTPAGFWLDFDDSGCFEVTDAGRTLRWYRPTADCDDVDVDAAARIDVQGRVLALALHEEGRLCLHGSGVCTGGVGLGFLAPKFHGKSTLALALVSAGARLITDDTLVVDPGPIPLALPGVHAMRLWSDTARRLLDRQPDNTAESLLDPTMDPPIDPAMTQNKDRIAGRILDTTVAASIGAVLDDGDKLCLRGLAVRRRMLEPAPLAAVYLLAPVIASASDQRPAVIRTLLSPTTAALALIGNGKLTPLLGQRQAAIALRRAIDVARVVPVYTLSLVRDFSRLQEVVEQILAWHEAPVTSSKAIAARDAVCPSVAGQHFVVR